MQPLVSIICLCYNHHPFLEEAIESVLNQTYSNIEIILVDDASTDGSNLLLKQISDAQKIRFIDIAPNVGNCTAFNNGWSFAKGEFVIDFATDDVMELDRIEKQIEFFKLLPADYGVVYSNATYIDSQGNNLYKHFGLSSALKRYHPRYHGDIYRQVLREYFIPPPTMMIKNEVLASLNGYNETLAYEDFDFWVRSSRNYKFAYQDNCLTKIRKVERSLSSKLYKKGDKQLLSTFKVCKHAVSLNKNVLDNEALNSRLRYEFRHALLTENFEEAQLFYDLLSQQGGLDGLSQLLNHVRKIPFPLKKVRNLYLDLWHGGKRH